MSQWGKTMSREETKAKVQARLREMRARRDFGDVIPLPNGFYESAKEWAQTVAECIRICKRRDIDPERMISQIEHVALTRPIDRAAAFDVVLDRLNARGYPEPLIVPDVEKCPCCYTPKTPCDCGAFPVAPEVPPDVPGWMGAMASGPSTEGDPIDRAALDALPVLLEQPPIEGRVFPNFDPEKHVVSWDNPPPCTCGSVQTTAYDHPALSCLVCNRWTSVRIEDLKASLDTDWRALVLAAWTEGKGKAGEVYYVESEPGDWADFDEQVSSTCPHVVYGVCHDCQEKNRVESEPAEPVCVIQTKDGDTYVNGDPWEPTRLSGKQLDQMGVLYGLERLVSFDGNYRGGESDEDYRQRLTDCLTGQLRPEPHVPLALVAGVDDHPFPWPCKCGAGVMEVLPKRDKDGDLLGCCPACDRRVYGANRSTLTENWNRNFGVQPKGETPGQVEEWGPWEVMHRGELITMPPPDRCHCGAVAAVAIVPSEKFPLEISCNQCGTGQTQGPVLPSTVWQWNDYHRDWPAPSKTPEPTWDNPGPCVCGGEARRQVFGDMHGLKCIECGKGTGAHFSRETVLSAWVNREADHE